MSSGNPIRDALRTAKKFDHRQLSRRRANSEAVGRSQAGGAKPSRRNSLHQVEDLGDFDLSCFANVDHLHAVYRILEREGGEGPGTDRLSYHHFSASEVFEGLRQVSKAIVQRQYVPYQSRQAEFPKPNGKLRILRLQRILDRVVSKGVQLTLTGFWRTRLPRVGKGVWDVYTEMQNAVRQHRTYILAIDDVRDCFTSFPVRHVIEDHQRHIHQPELLWLIERIIRGQDDSNCKIGLEQGSPYSPIAMELTLHTRLDTRLETERKGFPSLHRYVDNINILCNDEREGESILQTCRDTLNRSGLHLKNEDGPPRDLRDTDLKVLGLNLGWDNGRLTFGIPESAYTDLETALINTMVGDNPRETAERVANGWIEACGPAFTNTARPEIIEKVLSLARNCGFTELNPQALKETAGKARKRWLQLSEGSIT